MHHLEFPPPHELRDAIKCFWYTGMELGAERSGFEVVPDGYAEIIFYFGNPLGFSADEGAQTLPSPFIIGLLNQPVTFYTQNTLHIIGIRCYPWTLFDLLGLPTGKDGVLTFEHAIAQLQSILAKHIGAGEIEDAIAVLNQYFADHYSQTTTDAVLSKAGDAMSEAHGTIPVSRVAQAAHSTVRTLERKFNQSSGHTVKDVSALMRFEQVRNNLWVNPDSNLAALAHELGYTDQAHLSREFKRYSGTTPAAFARKAKKGKQVLINDVVAFIH